MAKGVVKLTKLKSVLKKWNSFSYNKQSRSVSNNGESSSSSSSLSRQGLIPVFVGKTKRRYFVSSDVVGHPLFQELVDRSREENEVDEDTIIVSCEVVLFEHLLWMLENADLHPESLNELVEYYAC